MDTFNRYQMRSSGEEIHQAQDEAEAVTFAILDWLKKMNLFSILMVGKKDGEKSQLVKKLCNVIKIAMDNH